MLADSDIIVECLRLTSSFARQWRQELEGTWILLDSAELVTQTAWRKSWWELPQLHWYQTNKCHQNNAIIMPQLQLHMHSFTYVSVYWINMFLRTLSLSYRKKDSNSMMTILYLHPSSVVSEWCNRFELSVSVCVCSLCQSPNEHWYLCGICRSRS